MLNFIFLGLIGLLLTSCLKTRGDLSEQDQSRVYGKKNVDNQMIPPSQLGAKTSSAVDERDELIRGLNGRVESLENQIMVLQKEKTAAANSPEPQKIQLMQEALVKMEAQLQKLEAEAATAAAASAAAAHAPKPSAPVENKTDLKTNIKKDLKKNTEPNSYDLAQDYFGKKEWKKAILSYQKYIDENSKGKNVADAKYKIGVCFQELGMKEEAMAFYEEVLANYGKSETGKKAKIRLAKLKK